MDGKRKGGRDIRNLKKEEIEEGTKKNLNKKRERKKKKKSSKKDEIQLT